MNPEVLRERIRAAAMAFTEEVSAIFGEALASMAADFASTGGLTDSKKAGRIDPRPAPPTPDRGKPKKRNRRSIQELDDTAHHVLRLLSSHKKGLRMEELNEYSGMDTRELMRPIQRLLDDGKIKKSGNRRATVYFVP